MVIPIQDIIPWFIRYKYWIIFPITVVEGPIITIVTGLLASGGYISLFVGYLVVVAGDLVGDAFYYFIGRFGSQETVRKYAKYIGLNANRLLLLEKQFQSRPHGTFALGKAAHGAGTMVLLAAGFAKYPFWKMIWANILPTLAKSLVLILIGYYFGAAYLRLNSYLNYLALIGLAGFVVAYIIFIRKTRHNDGI